MGWRCRVIQNEIKHATSANVEVCVIEKVTLHVLFIDFTVYLSPGSLYRIMKSDERQLNRNPYPDRSTLRAIQDLKLNTGRVYPKRYATRKPLVCD